MAIDGKKLVNYLAHKIPQVHIAEALGLTASRISQLACEPKVMEAVAKKKKEIAESGMTDIADLHTIKRTLIGRMGDLAASTESLSEAVTALEKIDRITAQRVGQEDNASGVNKVIMMAPIFLQQRNTINIDKDSSNRIVAIQGRSMAPMPTKNVLDIVANQEE